MVSCLFNFLSGGHLNEVSRRNLPRGRWKKPKKKLVAILNTENMYRALVLISIADIIDMRLAIEFRVRPICIF